jgi:hypothetical protein
MAGALTCTLVIAVEPYAVTASIEQLVALGREYQDI